MVGTISSKKQQQKNNKQKKKTLKKTPENGQMQKFGYLFVSGNHEDIPRKIILIDNLPSTAFHRTICIYRKYKIKFYWWTNKNMNQCCQLRKNQFKKSRFVYSWIVTSEWKSSLFRRRNTENITLFVHYLQHKPFSSEQNQWVENKYGIRCRGIKRLFESPWPQE